MTSRKCMALYLAVALPVCFLFLGRTDVVSMEGIIALGARHMLHTGDWLVPRLYGDIYAFKPPLAYWMAAGMEALFGRQTEFTLRLPSALCGFLIGAFLVWMMGRLVSPRCGLFCGLAAVTSALFIEQVGIAGFDMPVALGLTVAMLAACRNLTADRAAGWYWLLGYAGLVLAFLSKGIPALVLCAPGLLVAAVAVKRFSRLFEWRHLCAVVLFLAAISLYGCLAYRAEGAAAFNQHLGEIAYRSGRWTPATILMSLSKPAVILAVLLPWSLVATGWVLQAASNVLKRTPRWSASLAGWSAKLLPLPLSMDAACAARVTWAFLLTGILTFLAVPTDDTRYYLVLVGPLAMLAGLSLERLPEPKANRVAFALMAVGLVFWVVQAGFVQPRRAEKRSLRTVAEAFELHVPSDVTIHVDTQDSYSSLFYYLGRPVQAWRSVDQQPPEGSFVIIVDGERPAVNSRSRVEFEPITDVKARDKHRYTLGRLVAPGTGF